MTQNPLLSSTLKNVCQRCQLGSCPLRNDHNYQTLMLLKSKESEKTRMCGHKGNDNTSSLSFLTASFCICASFTPAPLPSPPLWPY